ncbi:hypothetical protein KM295_07620 [Natronomonas sp. F2-12]|jgi:predicted  nucleic acid-binding Zn-ribbon protein|uniref:Uncharacterized protein n=1 Tax=Natronomonas aquatica TaxID=2841590 RepID=A0A9R1CT61_9EURY|nr:hypothetical protein [Natronomonas aquatica]MCQ4333348.1 hypothetical protein [Natronomonas aquatica]
MTDADPEEIATVASDGVTVEKSFEPDDFPVPAIAFRIRSERDTDVSVRLADVVPDDVAPENIGFHPKYGAEFWDVEDGRIVFQRTLAPGEEYTTVYGLRGGDADTAAKFMSEPTLESVDPPRGAGDESDIDAALDAAEIGDVTPPDRDSAELALSGETPPAEPVGSTNGSVDAPDVLGIDDATEAESRSESAPPTADAPEERIEEADTGSGGTDKGSVDKSPTHADSPAGAEPRSEQGSLVSELASEIREGDVDDDDLMDLRDALGLDLASASVEARIEHLQSSVSDLEAYTDAMEEFIDEEGDARTLIAEARDGYEETTDRLEELETELEGLRSDLDRRLDSIDERIEETIDGELTAIRADIESVEERIDTEADERIDLESDIEALSTELAEVAEMRDRLTNALSGLSGGAPSDDAVDVTADSDVVGDTDAAATDEPPADPGSPTEESGTEETETTVDGERADED